MKNIWKLLLIALLAFAMIGCPTTKEDSDDGDDNGGSGVPAISWWLEDATTVPGSEQLSTNFPYGFKFSTRKGWESQYVASSIVNKAVKTFDKIQFNLSDKTTATVYGPYNTGSKTSPMYDMFNDDSTKLYIDEALLSPGALYTLTFTTSSLESDTTTDSTVKTESSVSFGAAASGATATNESKDTSSDEDVYISGGKQGAAWAGDTDFKDAEKLKKVSDGVYEFTWAAPAKTVKVTLKIIINESTVLKLTNVPAMIDGNTTVDGSYWGWNGGSDVKIAKKAGEEKITGGEYEINVTAESNAAWAVSNYYEKSGKSNFDYFHAAGTTDLLQIKIGTEEKWVPYVEGQTKIFSWAMAWKPQ